VLFRLGRRVISLATGFFALLGFVAVPIGDRTGFEHVKTALGTSEGQEAIAAVGRAWDATRERCLGWMFERLHRASDAALGTPSGTSKPPLRLPDLVDGRDRDSVHNHGSPGDPSLGLVGHDEDGQSVGRSGRRKDTGVTHREER